MAGLFLFAQTATLLHAEIHPFHEHTEVCNAFEMVEHQAPGLVDFTPFIESDFTSVFQPRFLLASFYVEKYGRLPIRAPPLVS